MSVSINVPSFCHISTLRLVSIQLFPNASECPRAQVEGRMRSLDRGA
ncbi:MAG: hypothetical protein AB1352_03120 [Patescibacteria group bacterium]